MILQKEYDLFSEGASVLVKTDHETKYQINCDTPDGTMHCYHLFPGIDLSYTTFEAGTCYKRQQSLQNMLEIAYCSNGRYECEYKRNFLTYLGEGDLAISLMDSQREKPVFPTGFYDGTAIIIDLDITGRYFSSTIDDISIDFSEIIQKFCTDRCCSVMQAPPELSSVFHELLNPKMRQFPGYLRLKVLELLFLLSNKLPENDLQISAYYSGSIIKKVKAVKEDLMADLDSKISLKDLSIKHDLSLTMMKECFKAIYGKPIYTFWREYKMQVATRLLLTTKSSVSEIAGMLGYENPNKFSSAFKSIIGVSPRNYRNQNR